MGALDAAVPQRHTTRMKIYVYVLENERKASSKNGNAECENTKIAVVLSAFCIPRNNFQPHSCLAKLRRIHRTVGAVWGCMPDLVSWGLLGVALGV